MGTTDQLFDDGDCAEWMQGILQVVGQESVGAVLARVLLVS
jgi:hypothetical protein